LVDREVLDRRLARIEELLTRLRQLAGIQREEYLRDPGLQAQAERWLQLCAESVLEVAAHVIADSGLRTPTTHRESFRILAESGVLEEALARQMERWAGLRNVLCICTSTSITTSCSTSCKTTSDRCRRLCRRWCDP